MRRIKNNRAPRRGRRVAKVARNRELRALCVHQPDAWLIVNGIKDVENRQNPPPDTRLGQRVYVHAPSRRVTKEEFEHFLANSRRYKVRGAPKSIEDFEYGAIIGSVVITGSMSHSRSRWANFGMCHWLLTKASRSLPAPYGPSRPKRIKGQQCLFWKFRF